jgi:hypothetical protein
VPVPDTPYSITYFTIGYRWDAPRYYYQPERGEPRSTDNPDEVLKFFYPCINDIYSKTRPQDMEKAFMDFARYTATGK